ncbi:DUF6089 family protein [Chryseosolibacter indicus]|uniref:Outer membrane beta-barrel protein n=1 Tax=Chryseosolibacter indicus TaxID=2782351 RepID=A0ABS5VX71_9BACT|nr:DUF6089 family protein [Chryseosolibacter indicus]MBT1706008.1 outer membrane beta-barrel protein [Chryseosolibacter indicus]
MMTAKSILFTCTVCILSAINGVAQRSELGFGIGTFSYTGDLAKNYNLLNSKPAATIFYRSNLSSVVSFRAALTGGGLGASDEKRPYDAFAEERAASFSIFLMEASTVMEYHFLNWRSEKRMLRFTPYLFAGLGLFGMSGHKDKTQEYSNVQGAIPFGLGFKYVINPKWYLSLEFGARKTFFDYLDNISEGDQRYKDFQYGNPNDTDAYYFLGLSLTRTFYSIPCPTNPYR